MNDTRIEGPRTEHRRRAEDAACNQAHQRDSTADSEVHLPRSARRRPRLHAGGLCQDGRRRDDSGRSLSGRLGYPAKLEYTKKSVNFFVR